MYYKLNIQCIQVCKIDFIVPNSKRLKIEMIPLNHIK